MWHHIHLSASLLLCSWACAKSPDWAGELTSGAAVSHQPVSPCEVTFALSWKNVVKAGTATLRVREAGDYWRADATAASTGLARALWKYNCEMTSLVVRDGLRAHYLQHSETDSEETCSYRVSFERRRVITETQVRPKSGAPVSAQSLCSFGPMDDLLSVILYLRSLELKEGQKITRVVQPWDKPYLTTFSVMGRETLHFGGEGHPCIKVGLKIRKIDRETLVLSDYRKMKSATIWVSDDALRVPVEMHAEIFVGYISARMTGIKMLGRTDSKAPAPPRMKVKALSKK